MDVRASGNGSSPEMIRFYELEAGRNINNISAAINCYLHLVSIFNSLKNRTPEENRKFSIACHRLANCYFFNDEYRSAAEYYHKGTQVLQEIKHYTDEDSRNLVICYINLADAFLEMKDQPSAYNAFLNAIVAFNRIREKKIGEEAIGDPNKNYRKFYVYYESICSDVSYRCSTTFNNNEHFLYEQHKDGLLFGELGAQLGLTAIDQNVQREESIETRVYGSDSGSLFDSFIQIDIQEQLKDKHYRSSASRYIELGYNYYVKKDYQAIDSWQQALETLKLIKDKNEKDSLLIKQLEEKIIESQNIIKQRQVGSARMPFQNQPPSIAQTSTMGMYAPRPQMFELPGEKREEEHINRMEM